LLRWFSRQRDLPPPDTTEDRTTQVLGIGEIEAAALKLPRSERARLIRKLLETTEDLTDEEVVPVIVAEERRPDAAAGIREVGDNRPVDDVLRDARARLKGFTRPRRTEPPA
jgi:hypothetical protein